MYENSWIAQIFSSDAARNGGIVRRNVADVLRFSSPYELVLAVQARDFHMLQVGDQYLVLCDPNADMKIVC